MNEMLNTLGKNARNAEVLVRNLSANEKNATSRIMPTMAPLFLRSCRQMESKVLRFLYFCEALSFVFSTAFPPYFVYCDLMRGSTKA